MSASDGQTYRLDSRPPASYIYDSELPSSSKMLAELLDGTEIDQLFESSYTLLGMPMAVLDLHANVLISSRWQRICTDFHRVHPTTCAICVESDRYMSACLGTGEPHAVHTCRNGLTYCASPILLEGKHVADVFIGQFFTQPPDMMRFRRQAETYGWNVEDYLDAVSEVRVISEKLMFDLIDFLSRMTRVVTGLSRDRKRAMATQDQQAVMLNTIPQAVFWKDIDGKYLGCNQAFVTTAGLNSPAQVIGKTDYDLPWPKAEADAYRAMDQTVIESKQPILHIIEPLQTADGRRLIIDTSKVPLVTSTGTAYGLVGIYQDITGQEKSKRELVESEERFKTAFMTSWDAMYLATLEEGRIIDANDATVSLLGYEWDEVVGRTSIELGLYEDPQQRAQIVSELKQLGFIKDVRLAGRKKSGEKVLLSITMRLLRTEGGAHIFGVLRDITERERVRSETERLEAQLRQSQKMESIGQLAGGVAHDFNNLLCVILNCADMGLSEVEVQSNERLRSNLEEIGVAGKRAAALTRQLLAFSRKQLLQPELLDLNVVVGGVEKMLRRLVAEDIEIIVQLADDLDTVTADPGQIEQVVMNLVVNARNAMPDGGRLVIETANVEVDETDARLHPSTKPGAYVALTISDTGCGIDPEIRDRIFEPFFTTKSPGEGTGLGLSMVYGIVKQSGGDIWVHSEPGHGASFKVLLPQVADSARIETGRVTPATVCGTETILVVEDEDAVRAITEHILRDAGYTVLSAPSGKAALLVADDCADTIDLLMTDIVMPSMSGRELSELLVEARPGLKVLYVSGYTSKIISHHGLPAAGMCFLSKPFTAAELGRKVRELLDSD
jgi:two-component system cell cycle sensor histidine kinase/response regulator CckA